MIMPLQYDYAMKTELEVQKLNGNVKTATLKEHDAIFITNPTNEDFSWKFGGETYMIPAGEIKSFSKFVTFHLAKHLSTQMITEDITHRMTKAEKDDRNAPVHLRIAQLVIYDTHERRMALYRLLGNKELVQTVIEAYPFKGFIGDMGVYDKFVEKQMQEFLESDNVT